MLQLIQGGALPPDETRVETLGDRVKRARLARHESASEVGRRASVRAWYVSLIEKGERYPTPAVVAALARARDVEAGWLVDGEAFLARQNALKIVLAAARLEKRWTIDLQPELDEAIALLEAEVVT